MAQTRTRLSLDWEVARHDGPDVANLEWLPAIVPGAVQLDWARAKNLPDYTIGENVRAWADLDNSWWTYRARLTPVPPLTESARVFLVLTGIDYAADIFCDGVLLGSHEGMQQTAEFDISEHWRPGAVVMVRIKPAPKSRPAPLDRSQADHSCKPAVSYGWDFQPRLIPLGLWNDAYLEVRSAVHLAERPYLAYQLDEACTRVSGQLELTLNQPPTAGMTVRWQLSAPNGHGVHAAHVTLGEGQKVLALRFALSEIELWWPHDQGTPALYASKVELISPDGRIVDADSAAIGFRRVRLVMAPDQWELPVVFPKSRSRPPITVEINGRSLFVKGTNWVCPDIFPGTMTRERFAAQLALVRQSNLDFVRVWGGAAAPQEAFFELCDELGLMVWQEFPLACNCYPDAPDYLNVLEAESRALIKRLRPHPSLVLWCGGNELFNAWSRMTDQSLPLRLLNRNCYELDPTRPFLPTAPIDGMAHGHYVFRDPVTGAEAWTMFQDAHATAYSEFGCPGPAGGAILERIIPADELWPPRAGTAWETHHALGAWLPSSHLYLEQIEHFFGPSSSLAELVERGQFLQGIGYQGLFEEARRQKPAASMALNWCFNEPWPCAANNSLVSWPCEPKPALDFVRRACRQTLASARIRKVAWSAGETFAFELWLLHDGPDEISPETIQVFVELDGERRHLGEWTPLTISPNANVVGPRFQFSLPTWTSDRFGLHLEVPARPAWSSVYTLLKARERTASVPTAVQIPKGTTNF